MAGAGGLHASNSKTNQELFRTYTTGTATPTSLIRASGAAEFDELKIGGTDGGRANEAHIALNNDGTGSFEVDGNATLSILRSSNTISNGAVLGQLQLGTVFTPDAATIHAVSVGNHSVSNKGSAILFSTTTQNTTAVVERVRIDHDGKIILQGTGSVEGIQFGTDDTNASPGGNITAITSQTLDDYEEGTFTPDMN